MKFQGNELKAVSKGSIKLPRPDGTFIEFKLRATGLGDETKGSRMFPDVRPPMDFVYDKKGLPARDPRNDQLLPREPNFFDPSYLSKQEEASRMQMVVLVVDALSEDPNIEWASTASRNEKQFYMDCYEEMKAAGITLGDIRLILRQSQVLGNLDSKALERAAESFSS